MPFTPSHSSSHSVTCYRCHVVGELQCKNGSNVLIERGHSCFRDGGLTFDLFQGLNGFGAIAKGAHVAVLLDVPCRPPLLPLSHIAQTVLGTTEGVICASAGKTL